jgi:hypothetical protein
MKQDRFLISILTGMLILVVLALALFFIRKSTQRYVSEDTPAGVVHNYILAIEKEDYERAYRYLADLPHKPSYEMFLNLAYTSWADMNDGQGVEIGKTVLTCEQAIVELNIVYDSGDPFYYPNNRRASLIQQNGTWKIKNMDWGGWRWDWYFRP